MEIIGTPRRYYLLRRIASMADGDPDLAGVWRWKQEQQPGTVLPDDFPLLSALTAVGYTTVEDLDGADVAELARAGFRPSQAKQILTALASLPGVEGQLDFSDPNQSGLILII